MGTPGSTTDVPPPSIEAVVSRMEEHRQRLPHQLTHLGAFLATYLRTTEAVGAAARAGAFADPDWVTRWDVAFADIYLDALDRHRAGERVSRPWRLAFTAPAALHPLQHVLLGMNAHVNYDLPQALLAVVSDEDFADPTVMALRRRDHQRIDAVLSSRVAAEGQQLSAGGQSLLDRVLTPLNRRCTRRFLREARQKVWHNTVEMQRARLAGPDAYRARLTELEVLSAGRVADLLTPGQVLLRLAVAGFGVTLPPPGDASPDRLSGRPGGA